MKRFEIGFLLLALSIASCSGVKEHAASAKSPGNSSGAGTGTTTTPPSRLCSLFTTAEIKDVLGAPVTDGKVAGPLDSACQWDGISGSDDAIYAQIQLINDTRYWEKHTGAQGYEVLHASTISRTDVERGFIKERPLDTNDRVGNFGAKLKTTALR